MAPGPVAEIVTEPGDGDALHVALGDVERGLGFSEMHGQGLREVRDACAWKCMRLCYAFVEDTGGLVHQSLQLLHIRLRVQNGER